MTLAAIADVMQILLFVLVVPFVFLFGRMFKITNTLTNSIRTIQEVAEKNTETARRFYDPEEVEKVVRIKMEKEKYEFEKEHEKKITELKQEHTTTKQDLHELLEQRQYLEKLAQTHLEKYKKLLRMFIEYYMRSLPTVERTFLTAYFDKYKEEDITEFLMEEEEKLPSMGTGNALLSALTVSATGKPGNALLSKSTNK